MLRRLTLLAVALSACEQPPLAYFGDEDLGPAVPHAQRDLTAVPIDLSRRIDFAWDEDLPPPILVDLSAPDLTRPDLARPDLSLPDLFRPDLSMPDMNGLALIDAVRRQWPHVRVALMTAADFTHLDTEHDTSAADIVLQKPFEIDELCYLIETVVGTARAR